MPRDIKDIKIKRIVRHHSASPIIQLEFPWKMKSSNFGEDVGKLKPSYIGSDKANGNCKFGVSVKLNNHIWLSHCSSECIAQSTEDKYSREQCCMSVQRNTVHNCKVTDSILTSTTDDQINTWEHIHNVECYSSIKIKEILINATTLQILF